MLTVARVVATLFLALLAGCGGGDGGAEEACDQGEAVSNECDDQGEGMYD